MTRRLVAFAGHAPGLWLCYRERLPRRLVVPNLIAAGVTVGAMIAVACGGVASPVLAWAIGHVAWGAYLVVSLEPPAS